MLAGFGFTSLKMQFPAGTSVIIEIVYLSITACAIGFELCAILNSACCSVFGPGKFLRGQGGLKAAEQAVNVLEEKSEITLYYFVLGLLCIVASSALKAFILYTLWNACIVTVGLGFITYILITGGNILYIESFFPRFEDIQEYVC